MQRIRSSETGPELLLKNVLDKKSIEYEYIVNELPGKPDFVIKGKKIILFVDSDFWHCHPFRCKFPKSNMSYWSKKLLRNFLRDHTINRKLKNLGWSVIRFWEFDIRKRPGECEKKINRILVKKRQGIFFLELKPQRFFYDIVFSLRIIYYIFVSKIHSKSSRYRGR